MDTGTATADERGAATEPGGAPAPEAGDDGHHRDWRHPSIDSVLVILLVLVAVRIGLQPLHDNSFLTHLSTGWLIFDTGSVPTADPYSFTAHGAPWTVQSWGASVIYAGLEQTVGLIGIRILNATMCVALALLLWRLTRPAGTFLARAIPAGLVVCMGTSLWVERPLLFGTVALALVYLAADDGLDPRWLVPVMWIWVNTHGSFPFGIGLLVLLVAGRWIDDRRRPEVELRALGWATVGTLLGAVNPIGPKMLVFPLRLLQRREAFTRVAEWEPPHFDRGVELFFAALLAACVILVVARHRRWRAILPLVAFGGMALTSTRNILPASIVLTPIFATAAAGLGTIDGRRRPQLLRPVAVALALLTVLVGLNGLADRNTALGAYPVKATTWMRAHHLLDRDDRVVARDWVGNFLHFQCGPDKTRVFIDDRVDMYPLPVIRDFTALIDPDTSKYQPVLERNRATAVLWNKKTDFARWLRRTDQWQIVYQDKTWIVALPAGATLPAPTNPPDRCTGKP